MTSMKTLIIILITAAFLQSTILPIDLVLIILICRAYIRSEKQNLYLGFAFGLVAAHLNLTTLGLQSFIYLVCIQLTQILSRLRLAGNPLLVVPVSLVFLTINQLVGVYTSAGSFDFAHIILATFLSLPILYLVRLWEERFVVRKEIKLKI